MSTPRFVAYYRVSTDKQGRSGLGLEAQRSAVQAHVAGAHGMVVWIGVELWLIRSLGAGRCHAARIRRALSRSSFARP